MSVVRVPIAETSRQVEPPLESGDRLTRAQFERRYAAMPRVKKAELIEGVVYMPSPVRINKHAKPHLILATWLGVYVGKTLGLNQFGDNATVKLDEDNELQPDLLLLLPASAGGKARIDGDDYVCGPPELVCEVASSSVSIDLHAKLNSYRRSGVREYLVWRTDDGAIDFFTLSEGLFEPIAADDQGLVKSGVFPGLWLDRAAILSGDMSKVLAAVERGVATPEHAEFVKRLAAKP